jgi:hypothetical protein
MRNSTAHYSPPLSQKSPRTTRHCRKLSRPAAFEPRQLHRLSGLRTRSPPRLDRTSCCDLGKGLPTGIRRESRRRPRRTIRYPRPFVNLPVFLEPIAYLCGEDSSLLAVRGSLPHPQGCSSLSNRLKYLRRLQMEGFPRMDVWLSGSVSLSRRDDRISDIPRQIESRRPCHLQKSLCV